VQDSAETLLTKDAYREVLFGEKRCTPVADGVSKTAQSFPSIPLSFAGCSYLSANLKSMGILVQFSCELDN